MRKNLKRQAAFTLVEIMVAVSIFSIVALAATNAFLAADRVNKKAQAMKTVIDNLHFALHSMAFNLKQGGVYHCFDGQVPATINPDSYKYLKDCPSGDKAIAFTTPKAGEDSKVVIYRVADGRIEYWHEDQQGSDFTPITVDSLEIKDMKFYVQNVAYGMPRVFITFQGEAKAGGMVSKLNLETVVSERL